MPLQLNIEKILNSDFEKILNNDIINNLNNTKYLDSILDKINQYIPYILNNIRVIEYQSDKIPLKYNFNTILDIVKSIDYSQLDNIYFKEFLIKIHK